MGVYLLPCDVWARPVCSMLHLHGYSICHGVAGVYVEEGPDRDALTKALAQENYLPVYLDPRTVRMQYPGYYMQGICLSKLRLGKLLAEKLHHRSCHSLVSAASVMWLLA